MSKNKWVIQITKPGDKYDGWFWSNCNKGPHEFVNDPRVLRFRNEDDAKIGCQGYNKLNKVRVVHMDALVPKYEDQTGYMSDLGPTGPGTPASVALREYTSAERKAMPVLTGVAHYFPDAQAAKARVSMKGNEKHNPGQPLHWSRGKSTDHLDCAGRHLLTPYNIDPDSGELELAHAAWRLDAALQEAEEKRLVALGIRPLSGVVK